MEYVDWSGRSFNLLIAEILAVAEIKMVFFMNFVSRFFPPFFKMRILDAACTK